MEELLVLLKDDFNFINFNTHIVIVKGFLQNNVCYIALLESQKNKMYSLCSAGTLT